MSEADQLRAEIETLKRLVMALAEKLYIVAQHLGRLSERADKRNDSA